MTAHSREDSSSKENEKLDIDVKHIEHNPKVDDSDVELLAPDRRVQAEKHLVRLLDMRLLPTIVLIFIMNYIDVSAVIFSYLAKQSV